MRSVCGTRSDRAARWRKSREKRKSGTKDRLPDTVKFISDRRIRKSADQPDADHASMIKLNNIYATRVHCVRSFVLDFEGPLLRCLSLFSVFSWGRGFHGLRRE